ncbi:MAG TPA: ABC transporter permease [Nitrospirae bacterium]|nr:putative phospholipid ABC transporter permease protein MlaE [bacterium BMS3Abin06]HDH12647.1 ABC transporter permease [Nitrospirota bacterium]HDY99907.1 ABC transporter permease [Nitrospirota bacterium]
MNIKENIARLQDFYILAIKAPLGIFRRPFYFREMIEQMDYMGTGSLFIVFLVSLFIGMALSLQISAELADLGLKMYTGKIVGVAIIREIGPVAVALVFAGRVGSGMASELGSMMLGHQVDILRVHGVNPVKKLVTPRVVSAIIMLPMLTVIGDAVSLLGGYYISVIVSHQSGSFYWNQIKEIMDFDNIFSGITKPFIFGYLISGISCYMGLSTRGGARGLRESTTTAVVFSMIMIIVSDFMLTKVLLYVLGMNI